MAIPDASRLYELADEVARGALVIPTARTFPLAEPLSEVQQATRLAESGGAGGKVVLIISQRPEALFTPNRIIT